MPKLLKCVEKNHPLLREIIPDVTDFNDLSLHETIENMRYSILPEQLKEANAVYESAAGMAANQWGINKRIFVFTPHGTNTNTLLEIMINPSYTPYLRYKETKPTMSSAYEGCFSIPLTTGIVKRYETIMATYYNPEGKKIERMMDGWEARVFQHETDHLNGKLFDGRLDHFPGPDCEDRIIFKNKEEMDAFWEGIVRPSRKK